MPTTPTTTAAKIVFGYNRHVARCCCECDSKQWYPIDIIADLDPAKPHAVKLLNQDLVLWREVDGGWRAFEDRCPHRLAPLSQGRIEPSNGALECAYHGWQFDKAGKAIRIPQLADPAAAATACGSSRSCVRSYPVQERYGLLWVWGEAGPQAAAEAALQPVPRNNVVELEATAAANGGKGWEYVTGWMRRDVPVTYDILVENLVDPCHVVFAHHGIDTVRRDQENGTTMKVARDTPGGDFEIEIRSAGRQPPWQVEFKAPNNVLIKQTPNDRYSILCTPLSTGWSRIFASQITATGQAKAKPNFSIRSMMQMLQLRVPVLEHATLRNPTFDSDNYLLHTITYKLLSNLPKAGNGNGTADGGGGNGGSSGGGAGAQPATAAKGTSAEPVSWRRQYYMPGSSDTAVRHWRAFLDQNGASLAVLPKSLADMPPQLTYEQCLERWHTHSASCRHCSRAAGLLQLAAGAVHAAAVVLLLLAAADIGRGLPLISVSVVLKLSAAAGSALLAPWLQQLREKWFFYEPWVHAEKV